MPPRTFLLVHSADEVGWTDLRLIVQSMPEIAVMGEAMTEQRAFDLAAAHRRQIRRRPTVPASPMRTRPVQVSWPRSTPENLPCLRRGS